MVYVGSRVTGCRHYTVKHAMEAQVRLAVFWILLLWFAHVAVAERVMPTENMDSTDNSDPTDSLDPKRNLDSTESLGPSRNVDFTWNMDVHRTVALDHTARLDLTGHLNPAENLGATKSPDETVNLDPTRSLDPLSTAITDVCHMTTENRKHAGKIYKVHVFRCSSQGLKVIPVHIPTTISELYLDFNSLTNIPSEAFGNLKSLKLLDLSNNNIHTLHRNSFVGLGNLEFFYLGHQKGLQISLPSGLFFPMSGLRILSLIDIGTRTYHSNLIAQLRNLTQLGISYVGGLPFPLELAQLPLLKQLDMSFGTGNLDQHTLGNLRYSHVEQLSFKAASNMEEIANDTFHNMTSLRLINFSCTDLRLDDIIDALSSDTGLAVEDLIVDAVNGGAYRETFGLKDLTECRPAWGKIRRLSFRALTLPAIHIHVLRCFINITTLTYAYNPIPRIYPKLSKSEMKTYTQKLVLSMGICSVWLSRPILNCITCYKKELGCYVPYIRIENSEYFPPASAACDEKRSRVTGERVQLEEHNDTFPTAFQAPMLNQVVKLNNRLSLPSRKQQSGLNKLKPDRTHSQPSTAEPDDFILNVRGDHLVLPPGLRYLQADHLAIPFHAYSASWMVFSHNQVHYLNLSYSQGLFDSLCASLVGLSNVSVWDLSYIGFYKICDTFFVSFPSLSKLHLVGNNLGKGEIDTLMGLQNLSLLDISSNQLTSLARGTFRHLSSLTTLRVANNSLQSSDFTTDLLQTLHLLDMSANRLSGLSREVTETIDRRCSGERVCQLEVNLHGNPLSCDCRNLDFILWFQSTSATLTAREKLTCSESNQTLFQVTGLEVTCFFQNHLTAVISGSVAMFLAGGVLAPLVYYFRRQLRWHVYRLRHRMRRTKYINLEEGGNTRSIRDVTVLYATASHEDTAFVFQTLVVELERLGYTLYCEGRDDVPGSYKFDVLVEMLSKSRGALWMLSRAFLQDTMCCLEGAHQAFMEFGRDGNIIIRRRGFNNEIEDEMALRRRAYFPLFDSRRYGIKDICYDGQTDNEAVPPRLNDSSFTPESSNGMNLARSIASDDHLLWCQLEDFMKGRREQT